MAFARLGLSEKAHDLFALVNPINHASDIQSVARYKVEPYVVAADVYSVPPHIGRGGWTWYTGSAGWMYRAGIEGILGVRRQGDVLVVDPCLPADWPEFSATLSLAGTSCEVIVRRRNEPLGTPSSATIDGITLLPQKGLFQLPLDGGKHVLAVELERKAPPDP